MRPLKLIVTGFGTYCNRTEIDLEKLGTNGLYLITGDTGSGKTTIFDAISYALFGDVNGQNRNISMIRSTYATLDIPTEVDLTFEYRGKIYNVKRNPEYERRAKKGDGVTTQLAEATLTMPDGNVITQHSKVTAAIVELLRIDYSQFSQIAMIAQGDFQKLLMEGTEKRQEIFRKIFKTDFYQQLQFKLLDEEKKLGVEQSKINDAIKVHLSNILYEEGDISRLPIQEQLELIERQNKDDSKLQLKLKAEFSDLEKANSELVSQISKLEETEKAAEALKEKKNQIEELSKNFGEIETALKNQKEKVPEREKLEADFAVKKEELSKYDELEKLSAEIAKNNSSVASKNIELSSINKQLESAKNEKEKLSEELKKLGDVGKKETELLSKKDKLLERESLVLSLIQNESELLKINDDLQASKKEYIELSKIAEKKEAEFSQKRKAYMDEQAGILAEELEDEKPCPVCGSIHHPNPACKSSDAPTEAELNLFEKEAKTAVKKADECSKECSVLKTKAEAGEKSLNEGLKKLGLESSKVLEVESKSIKKELSDLEESLQKESARSQRKAQIDELLPKLDVQSEEYAAACEKLSVEIAGLTAGIEALGKQIENTKKSLSCQSKDEAEEKLSEIECRIEQMKNELETAQKNFDDANTQKVNLEGQIKQLESLVQSGEKIDGQAKRDELEKIIQKKNELQEKLQNVSSRLERNCDSYNKIQAESEKLAVVEARYKWVSALSKTANGNLSSGKEKIKLETYIQMTYFDRIIAHANKRFLLMSNGQYELVRKKEAENLRSQTGLELDVIDHYNGGQRSVKSLSGGESFEASLSLALGLSDEVRVSAGGIKIDSLFVDEGFGTLDSESLQKAFAALTSITEGNRLVGIISHVDYLKEKIDRQIVVKKQRTGGSTVQINV